MIGNMPELNRNFILSRVSQEEVFLKYLNLPYLPTERFCSPLRKDDTPTCSFKKYDSGLIWFKDWSGHFSGDCFALVQFMYNCNFYDACKQIAIDFKLIDGKGINQANRKPIEKFKVAGEATIQVHWRKYKPSELAYWQLHGISHSTLKVFHVAPIQHAWINGKLVYGYRKNDIAYAYWFKKGQIKLYFPQRQLHRFMGNTKVLQGYEQLPKSGSELIVTKSLKDVMFLYENGYPAVAPQSESVILSDDQYSEFRSRFRNLYSLYDFDYAGIRSANKMRNLYNIPAKFFTNGRFGTSDYGGKDITDLAKAVGPKKALYMFEELLDSKTWY